MAIQIVYAVLAGLLTVGAPCILPLLPVILGSSIGQPSRLRPALVTAGFILTFTASGLLLSTLVTSLMLAPDTLRRFAVFFLAVFGLFLVWPQPFEKATGYLSGFITRAQAAGRRAGEGKLGALALGAALGIIWTPCAGPVLGSILTLVAAQTDLAAASVLLFAYAVGAGVPLLAIGYATRWVSTRIPAIAAYARRLQLVFGLLILGLAAGMLFGYDLLLQQKLLEYYPETYFVF